MQLSLKVANVGTWQIKYVILTVISLPLPQPYIVEGVYLAKRMFWGVHWAENTQIRVGNTPALVSHRGSTMTINT